MLSLLMLMVFVNDGNVILRKWRILGNKNSCLQNEWREISQHFRLPWNITQRGSGRCWWSKSPSHPPPPLTSFWERHRFMSCPLVWVYIRACVCCCSVLAWGQGSHKSLCTCYDPNRLAAALLSLIGGPHSISAMPAQEGRSVLIFL